MFRLSKDHVHFEVATDLSFIKKISLIQLWDTLEKIWFIKFEENIFIFERSVTILWYFNWRYVYACDNFSNVEIIMNENHHGSLNVRLVKQINNRLFIEYWPYRKLFKNIRKISETQKNSEGLNNSQLLFPTLE